MKILVVEDEAVLRRGLVDLLEGTGYAVDAVGDGLSALAACADPTIDFVLLDLMLPEMNGIEVCRKVRELRRDLPILMLTARGAESDKVEGLAAGADDYVTKPFGTRELLARIEALSRRAHREPDTVQTIEADDCRIDLGRCEARRADHSIGLTARETGILRWLFHNRARAVSRSELLERVWGSPGDLNTRTVDMTIANLRQKIERDPADPRIVVTVKGVGYAWNDR